MRTIVLTLILSTAQGWAASDLEKARDTQDRAAIAAIAKQMEEQAGKNPGDANAQYKLAQAQSFLAEVAMEQHDKVASRSAAESGIKAAEKAVAINGNSA